MRSDLDTARGIFWWAVVPLLVLLLVVSGVANAEEVWYGTGCSSPDPAGVYAYGNCAAYDFMDHTEVDDGTPVSVCRGGGFGSGGPWHDCYWAGAMYWVTPPAMVDGDLIGLHSYVLADPESLGFLGGGDPDPDPEPGDEWTLEDLDLSKGASAFAAAFMIVALFWGLGKSVGLLVGFLRRL